MRRLYITILFLFFVNFGALEQAVEAKSCGSKITQLALRLRIIKTKSLAEIGNQKYFDKDNPRSDLIEYVSELKKWGVLEKNFPLAEFIRFIETSDSKALHHESQTEVYAGSPSISQVYRKARELFFMNILDRQQTRIQNSSFFQPTPFYKFSVYRPGMFIWKIRFFIIGALILAIWEPVQSELRRLGYWTMNTASDVAMGSDEEALSDSQFYNSQGSRKIHSKLRELYFISNDEYTSLQQISRNSVAYFYALVSDTRSNITLMSNAGDQEAVEFSLFYLYILPYIYEDLWKSDLTSEARIHIQNTFDIYDSDKALRSQFEEKLKTIFEQIESDVEEISDD